MDTETLKQVDLPFTAAEIRVRVTRRIVWNSFPGSVVHGVLGMNLKERSCVVTHRHCSKCFLVQSCQYGALFESKVPEGAERMRLYPQTPHPVRVSVFPWDSPSAEEDSELRIRLYLYGNAVISSLSCLLSLEKALNEGVGRKHGGMRGRGQILTVCDLVSGNISNWDELKLKFYTPVQALPLGDLVKERHESSLSVEFDSPTKLTVGGNISFDPGLRDVVAALLRRISNLQYFYNHVELDLPFKEILDSADSLDFVSDLRRVQARRYSSRQQKSLSVSGVMGSLSVEDCPEIFSNLLLMGQYLGVGKNTTMGLGSFKLH